MLAKIFAIFVAIDVVTLFLIYLIRLYVFKNNVSFAEGLKLFLEIDTGYYLNIAENWYQNIPEKISCLVFFPTYPCLIKTVNFIFDNYLLSALFVSGVLYACDACILFSLLRCDFGESAAIRGVKYLAIMPGAFFFVAPMTESLFLFLSLLVFLFVKKGKWFLACVAGAAMALTRLPGVFVIAPLFFYSVTGIVTDKENRKKWVGCLLQTPVVLVGAVCYLIINYSVTGDPLKFLDIEKEIWGQSNGMFFNTAAYQFEMGLSSLREEYFAVSLGLWLPNVFSCCCSLILMIAASRKIDPCYLLWFIVYYFMVMGATYLISAPRYLVAFLPIYPALTAVTESKKTDRIITAVSAVLSAYYLFAFAARWEVF